MKYIIKNSDLFLDGKLIPEGTELNLTEEQAKGLESFLIPVSNPELTEGHPEQIYAELSRSSEGAEIKVTQTKTKGNKK